MPEGYGVPAGQEGLLSWAWAEDRLKSATNYWVVTAGADLHPHATPVWGVFVQGRFYFDGSPETRRGRHIAANPFVAVHLESATEVVMLEGEATQLQPPARTLAEEVAAAYRAKYADAGYAPEADQWDIGGLYEMRPSHAYAWTEFPKDATRWRFA